MAAKAPVYAFLEFSMLQKNYSLATAFRHKPYRNNDQSERGINPGTETDRAEDLNLLSSGLIFTNCS